MMVYIYVYSDSNRFEPTKVVLWLSINFTKWTPPSILRQKVESTSVLFTKGALHTKTNYCFTAELGTMVIFPLVPLVKYFGNSRFSMF